MPEQIPEPVFLTVSCRPFDGAGEKDTLLASALEKALSGGCSKGSAHGVEAGGTVRFHYKISPKEFFWRKTCGRVTLQESFRRAEGYSLITRGMDGALRSESVYSFALKWQRTAWFSESSSRPDTVLSPGPNGAVLLIRDAHTDRYRRKELMLCPLRPGTAAQSYVNSTVGGEPDFFVRTEKGLFCFCAREEQEKRTELLRRLDQNGGVPDPDWPREKKTELDFSYIPNDGADSENPSEPSAFEAPAVPAFAAAACPSGKVSGTEEKAADLDSEDYALDREVFSSAPPKPEPIPNPVPAPEPRPVPDPVPVPRPAPAKYAVAAKGLSGGVIHAKSLEYKSSPDGEPFIPAKRIVVSEEESYLYFGGLIGGLREGLGRTQMKDGHTAYEGGYRDDLRDGFGVYYYKSGKLCYAGNWKRNLRNGMGVAFGSSDGTVFIGKWKDGIPTGRGSAFDMEGNLLYTGEWKDGRRHGRGTEYSSGRAVRSGEWREGEFRSGWSRTEEPLAQD